MVIDFADGKSASGWGHPATTPEATKIVEELPRTHPVSKPAPKPAPKKE
jgi:hypothetical protein